jgi:hypothetical protein
MIRLFAGMQNKIVVCIGVKAYTDISDNFFNDKEDYIWKI